MAKPGQVIPTILSQAASMDYGFAVVPDTTPTPRPLALPVVVPSIVADTTITVDLTSYVLLGFAPLSRIDFTYTGTNLTVTKAGNSLTIYCKPTAPNLATEIISYTATDGTGRTSNASTVTLTVSGFIAPTITGSSYGLIPGQTRAISLSSLITRGTYSINTVEIVSNSAPVTASVTSGTEITLSAADTQGTASGTLVLRVKDSQGNYSANANFTVSVTNSIPVATNFSTPVATLGNVTLDLTARVSDPDGNLATLSNTTVNIGTAPTKGTAVVQANGTIIYTNTSGSGSDTFTYRVQDKAGAYSSYATVTVNIAAVNVAPVAPDIGTIDVNVAAAPIAIDLRDYATDANGDTLTFSITSGATIGVSSIAGGVITFTPPDTLADPLASDLMTNPFDKTSCHHCPISDAVVFGIPGGTANPTNASPTYDADGKTFQEGDLSPLVWADPDIPRSGNVAQITSKSGDGQKKYLWKVGSPTTTRTTNVTGQGNVTDTFPVNDLIYGGAVKYPPDSGEGNIVLWPKDGAAADVAVWYYKFRAGSNSASDRKEWPISGLDTKEFGSSGSGASSIKWPSMILRAFEISGANPKIQHALQCASCNKTGPDNGATEDWQILAFDRSVWPSYGRDGTARMGVGWFPYGTTFSIPTWLKSCRDSTTASPVRVKVPTSLDASGYIDVALNLTTLGKAFFDCLYNYGLRSVDGSDVGVAGTEGTPGKGGKMQIRCDQGMTTALQDLVDAEFRKLMGQKSDGSGARDPTKFCVIFPVRNPRKHHGTPSLHTDGTYYLGGGGPRTAGAINTAWNSPYTLAGGPAATPQTTTITYKATDPGALYDTGVITIRVNPQPPELPTFLRTIKVTNRTQLDAALAGNFSGLTTVPSGATGPLRAGDMIELDDGAYGADLSVTSSVGIWVKAKNNQKATLTGKIDAAGSGNTIWGLKTTGTGSALNISGANGSLIRCSVSGSRPGAGGTVGTLSGVNPKVLFCTFSDLQGKALAAIPPTAWMVPATNSPAQKPLIWGCYFNNKLPSGTTGESAIWLGDAPTAGNNASPTAATPYGYTSQYNMGGYVGRCRFEKYNVQTGATADVEDATVRVQCSRNKVIGNTFIDTNFLSLSYGSNNEATSNWFEVASYPETHGISVSGDNAVVRDNKLVSSSGYIRVLAGNQLDDLGSTSPQTSNAWTSSASSNIVNATNATLSRNYGVIRIGDVVNSSCNIPATGTEVQEHISGTIEVQQNYSATWGTITAGRLENGSTYSPDADATANPPNKWASTSVGVNATWVAPPTSW